MTARTTTTVRVSLETAEWLAAEADRRVVGRRLLVERAIDLLRHALEVAPDLVDLPPAPAGELRRAELRRRAGINP